MLDLANHPPHLRHEMDEIVASIRRHVRDHIGKERSAEYYQKLDQLLQPMVEDLDPSRTVDPLAKY